MANPVTLEQVDKALAAVEQQYALAEKEIARRTNKSLKIIAGGSLCLGVSLGLGFLHQESLFVTTGCTLASLAVIGLALRYAKPNTFKNLSGYLAVRFALEAKKDEFFAKPPSSNKAKTAAPLPNEP